MLNASIGFMEFQLDTTPDIFTETERQEIRRLSALPDEEQRRWERQKWFEFLSTLQDDED
jgi:hypothetical protein